MNSLKIILGVALIALVTMCVDDKTEKTLPNVETTTSAKIETTSLETLNKTETHTTLIRETTTISGTTTTTQETETTIAPVALILSNPKSTIVAKAGGRLVTVVTIEVKKVNDLINIQSVWVDLTPINGKITSMRDDGLNGDKKEGDGIYTLQIDTPKGTEKCEKEQGITAIDGQEKTYTSKVSITVVKIEGRGSDCDIACPIRK